ncbi:hypothetical protein DPMN_001725 [Dreissena polymorpha]|uniref:Uncharacterized protein n=1 Tax=Dreissena polymorpha TaxID=45954 RepID=A0A9D4RQK6_DREPO|nr:hypothetical protein DPMN_001725 [Dreissena polymorpha]
MEKSHVLNAHIPRPLAHTKEKPTRTIKLSKTIVTTANVTKERSHVLNAFVPRTHAPTREKPTRTVKLS